MIIGVSGKIGSGKDTIGKIIQILTLFPTISNEKLIKDLSRDWNGNRGFQIEKFGGALKDIVCLLINCTRKQLEDQDFKNTPLGKEWRKTYYVANSMFDDNPIECEEELTPRKLLQLMGTECGRHIIHPNIWVNALMSKYTEEYSNNPFYNDKDVYSVTEEDEIVNEPKYPNWVITDVRFPNELKAIEDKGGFVIRVTRNNSELKDSFQLKNRNGSITNSTIHLSETALDMHPFKIRIDNSGTLEELIEKVKIVLKLKKII